MYRALYSFQATDPSALSFTASAHFTVMDTNDQYWWLVQNGSGFVGYVPANYLAKEEEVKGSEVIQSIERAIQAIHNSVEQTNSQYTPEQKSNLRKLVNHKKNMLEHYRMERSNSLSSASKGQAPRPPSSSSESDTPSSPPVQSDGKTAPLQNQKKAAGIRRSLSGDRGSKRMAPPPPQEPVPNRSSIIDCSSGHSSPRVSRDMDRIEHIETMVTDCTPKPHSPNLQTETRALRESAKDSLSPKAVRRPSLEMVSPRRGSIGVQLAESIAMELVELVRQNTGLSHDKSKVAVGTVVSHLRENVPAFRSNMDVILRGLHKGDASPMEMSQDAARLCELFAQMSACKEDSQQRSWALHEDEDVIMKNLQEMLSILTNADPVISREIVSQDSYNAIDVLVLYYQMETRVSIRLLLLQIFGALCSLDVMCISELLTSVLPLELARDMQTDTKDLVKLKHSALVLTMIFSMGEAVPIHHYDHLSRSFISFLLESIENPPSEWGDEWEEIVDLFINLLLAFNLHFIMPSENPLMGVLGQYGTAKTFTEKLMLLVNRGEDPVRLFDFKWEHQENFTKKDPVRLFDFEPPPQDSLLKFLSDLYSSQHTAGLLYTNDAMVLIDIVLRQLSDLCPGDKLRTEYLSLAQLIFKNSDYSEHRHRSDDLNRLFQRISNEHETDADMDRMIVRQIWQDFPDIFRSL